MKIMMKRKADILISVMLAAAILFTGFFVPDAAYASERAETVKDDGSAVNFEALIPQPDGKHTVQQLIVMLYSLAGMPEVTGGELSSYKDGSAIDAWAEDAVLWGVKTGVLTSADGKLSVNAALTEEKCREILSQFQNLPKTSVMKKDLETITKTHRPIGSNGEKAAVQYLKKRFADMGYTVTLQPYKNEEGKTGTNVIAVKKAAVSDADILVISAHHDSVPAAYGANDNGSGVTALLAAAEALKDVSTDTELRFISFTDEENGKNGSRYYTSTLSESELARMIGDIQLDMLGGLGSSGLTAATMDGKSNWLSKLVCTKDRSISLIAETASDHAAFQLAGIPSVLLSQDGRGYLYHSAADTVQHIDLYSLGRATALTSAIIKDIAAVDTGSYRKTAKKQGNGYVYTQRRQNTILFNSTRSENEAYIGAAGTLVDKHVDKGEFWEDTYETYRYSMRWFGSKKALNTYYVYRNDYLESIEIKPEETGYTMKQMSALIRKIYGKPTDSYTSEDGAVHDGWADEIYSKYISLEKSNPCQILINSYSQGVSNVLASYSVKNGNVSIKDAKHAAVWDYLCSILPGNLRKKISQFNLFTDGCGTILAYTATMDGKNGRADNSRFSVNVDYYDVYDENGKKRDWSKLTFTLLHEFGHVLLEDDTQIDLKKGEDIHDPAGFIDGSFRKAYYDQFWKKAEESGENDYESHPDHFVSQYAANYFHEDIAETFALFVLGDKPQGDTIAEQKLLFFWKDPSMMKIRTAIRNNMGLAQTGGSTVKKPYTLAQMTVHALDKKQSIR